MVKNRKEAFSTQVLQLIDAFFIWLSFLIAEQFRAPLWSLLHKGSPPQEALSNITAIMFVIVAFTPIALANFGFYKNPLHKSVKRSILQMFQTLIIVSMIVGLLVIFFLKSVESRIILGGAAPVAFTFLLIREWLLRIYLVKKFGTEASKAPIILAGSEKEMTTFLNEIPSNETIDWRIVEKINLEEVNMDRFVEKLKETSVGRVIFLARDMEFGRLTRAIERCELQGVEAWISASFIQTQIARPGIDLLAGKPMLVFSSTPELSWELLLKEVMDRVLAFFLILFSLPLWVVAIIGIKIQSPKGGVLFRQKRAGKYGKSFLMFKFRTMRSGAENELTQIKDEVGNEMSGPVFKLEKDPRVFPFGKFLRKFSIDEIPQLINVLIGDMSLVGPRPLPMYEVEQFEKSEHRRRLSVKPGITCDWQIRGRNQITSFEEWVRMDLSYIDNWSLLLDIKLLIKTVPAVLLGKGAK